MAELTAKLFRDYFGGSWSGRITKNADFQREIVFNWPQLCGKFSSLATETGLMAPPQSGAIDDTNQVSIASWHSDIRRWVLATSWIGLEPTSASRSFILNTASLSALGYEESLSRPVIQFWNDTRHVYGNPFWKS